MQSAIIRGYYEGIRAQAEAIECNRRVHHVGMDGCLCGRTLQQIDHLLCVGIRYDSDCGYIGRFITECDTESQGQKQGENEHPEDDLRLPPQFFHARSEQVPVSRPASVRDGLWCRKSWRRLRFKMSHHSSRRCRPVSCTNTSSRLAW